MRLAAVRLRQASPASSTKILFASSLDSEGLLVGMLTPDHAGALYLVPPQAALSPACRRIIIAPPPPPAFCNALLYIRSFNLLSGTYEALLSEIIPLTPPPSPPAGMKPFPTPATINPRVRGLTSLCGTIRAKSPILAKNKNKPAFLLEIGSVAEGEACVVVFSGKEAVRWWPFLTPGEGVRIGELVVFSLPRQGNRRVLKAGAGVAVWGGQADGDDGFNGDESEEVECVSSGSFSANGSPRIEAGALRQPAPGEQRIVSFAGVITAAFVDGRFEVDHTLILHIWSHGTSCAGPQSNAISFRPGAHVVIINAAVTYLRDRAVALFPTNRSFAYITSFGKLVESAVVPRRDSPWRFFWKTFDSAEVVWGGEVYEAMREKFGPWCVSGSSIDKSKEMMDALLGSPGDIGLVRHAMRMTGGVIGRALAKVDVHEDFMRGGEVESMACGAQDVFGGDFPTLNGLSDIASASDAVALEGRKMRSGEEMAYFGMEYALLMDMDIASVLEVRRRVPQKKRTSRARLAGYSPVAKRPRVRFHHSTVRFSDGASLAGAGRTAKAVEAKPSSDDMLSLTPFEQFADRVSDWENDPIGCWNRLTLVGCLGGSPESKGAVNIFDATGSLEIVVLGGIPISLLGAIVSVSRFFISLVFQPEGIMRRVIFADRASVRVVIDGPYAQQSPAPQPSLTCQSFPVEASTREGGRYPLYSQAILPPASTRESALPPSSLALSFDSRPIVAIFVSRVTLSTQAGDSGSCFRIIGRLLARKTHRASSTWKTLGDDRKGFLRCAVLVHNEASNGLYSVVPVQEVVEMSCSDLSSAESMHAWLWDQEDPRRKIDLVSGDDDRRVWMASLDPASIVADIESAPDEMSCIEKAVSFWLANDSAADVEHTPLASLCDVSTSGSQTRAEGGIVRLRGVLVSISHSGNDARTLVVRDHASAAVECKISVPATVCLPSWLLPGLFVELVAVSVLYVAALDSICLSLTGMSSIYLKTKTLTSLLAKTTSSLCCQRPVDFDATLQSVKSRVLWNYTVAGGVGISGKEADRVGIGMVSLCITQIRGVTLKMGPLKFGAAFCDWCATNGFSFTGKLEADVSDGTAAGQMSISGFRNVLDILCATWEDRQFLCSSLRSRGILRLDTSTSGRGKPRQVAASSSGFISHYSAPTEAGVPTAAGLLSTLAAAAPRHIAALVTRGRNAHEGNVACSLLDVNIHLRKGKRIQTAQQPGVNRAYVNCVGFFENAVASRVRGARRSSYDSSVGKATIASRIKKYFDDQSA